jgi:hypothetical protein
VNGQHTTARGHLSFSVFAIQVGDRMARVWLADETGGDVESPVVLEGDAVALKDGILLERSWSEAVVHKVTDEELAAGAAVIYLPGRGRPIVVELRFDPVRAPASSPGAGASAARRSVLAAARR